MRVVVQQWRPRLVLLPCLLPWVHDENNPQSAAAAAAACSPSPKSKVYSRQSLFVSQLFAIRTLFWTLVLWVIALISPTPEEDASSRRDNEA